MLLCLNSLKVKGFLLSLGTCPSSRNRKFSSPAWQDFNPQMMQLRVLTINLCGQLSEMIPFSSWNRSRDVLLWMWDWAGRSHNISSTAKVLQVSVAWVFLEFYLSPRGVQSSLRMCLEWCKIVVFTLHWFILGLWYIQYISCMYNYLSSLF